MSAAANWGASPEDWAHLELLLGIGEDLLPVVSKPGVAVSPSSKLKATGKVPSLYGADGVVGLARWTERRTTPQQIEAWSRQPDYGICIQTRRVRALDIDVEDGVLSTKIGLAFEGLAYGAGLPVRYRGNSGKRLLAFILEGDFSKRSFKVDGGLVEFLAGGQQFIAVGTHPSGARYEWAGGLPLDLPVISAAAFEAAWSALVAEFAIEPARESSRALVRGEDLDLDDDVAEWLVDNWETFGARGGKLFVACPWKDGHSSDSGETEAAWLLRGSRGFERGHFECLHASCQGRTDDDFLDAVGFRVAAFEVLEAEPQADGAVVIDESSPRGLARDKAGRIEPSAANLGLALDAPGWIGMDIRYDTFKGEVIWADPATPGAWRPWRDVDYFELRVRLEQRGFKTLGRELIRDAVHYRARLREIDTAMVWLDGLTWDGVPRVESFWPTYFGVQDGPYARACGLYTWTALAGRVLEPGLQADMVPILAGAQGVGKSRGVAAIAPGADLATAMSFHEPETERARKMRGVLVVELAELQGLRSRELEEIKAWITRSREHWTPKYQEMTTSYDRRCFFLGTTNGDDFLGDPTGERRWLPMRVEAVDIPALVRDREQLWAESAARFTAEGLAWGEALRLGAGEHEHYRASDTWEDRILDWLAETDVSGALIRTGDVLTSVELFDGPLRNQVGRSGKGDEMRLGKVLCGMGYERGFKTIEGRSRRVWLRKVALAPRSQEAIQ